jgi:FAD/FMN-containing dehydrogenase
VALLESAQQRFGPALTGFEVMNRLSLALVARHFPRFSQPLAISRWKVLVELSDSESATHARAMFEGLLADAIEAGTITDAAIAQSVAQSYGMWHLRESIPLAQSEEGLNIKHDIALPVSKIAAFCDSTGAALAARWPGVRLVNFGHLGDGNLHYNVQAPEGRDAAAFLRDEEDAVNQLVFDAVVAHGGSISAEHGIGVLKRAELARRKDPAALAMMRAIKRALDPQGLLNPGRVL